MLRNSALNLASAFAIGLTVTACTSSEPSKPGSTSITWLTEDPIGLSDTWRIASNPNESGVWLGYYKDKSSLFLRSPDNTTQTLVDATSGAAPSGLALALSPGNTPSSMWRDKVPSKGLFLKQGGSPALEIGVESINTEPLARFDIASDGVNGWHALWYGERFVAENNSKYNIYYRHIGTDGAMTPVETVLPGFYPQWVITEDGSVNVFSWDNTQSPPKIVLRQKKTASDVFGTPRTLAITTKDLAPPLRSFKLGGNMIVMWIDMRGTENQDILLRGMWSKDNGVNWSEFNFQTISGFDIADFKVAYEPTSGHAILSISGTWRFRDKDALDTFYIARSTDHGASWSQPKAIRSIDAAKFSRATAAQAFFGSTPGETWVVWEDWRDVRGRLYFAYSPDFGETWNHKDIPLAGQPEGNNILAYGFEQGYRDRQGQHLVAANVINDLGTGKRLFSIRLDKSTLDDSLTQAQKPQLDRNEKKLKDRETAFRKALADNNYEVAYTFFDPFMRSAWPLELYMQRMGRIKYKPEVVFDRVDIHGNYADVASKIIAFVPEFEMGGKKHSVPEREISITQRWVFVDNNWFLEYSEESSGLRFTRYR